jgi:hypothetical protein
MGQEVGWAVGSAQTCGQPHLDLMTAIPFGLKREAASESTMR